MRSHSFDLMQYMENDAYSSTCIIFTFLIQRCAYDDEYVPTLQRTCWDYDSDLPKVIRFWELLRAPPIDQLEHILFPGQFRYNQTLLPCPSAHHIYLFYDQRYIYRCNIEKMCSSCEIEIDNTHCTRICAVYGDVCVYLCDKSCKEKWYSKYGVVY